MDEQEYTKGFNQGYVLMQHNPKLAEAIFKSLEGKDNPLSLGIMDGGKEFMKEAKEKDRFMGMNQNYKLTDKDKIPDKDAQKDMDLERD